MDFMTDLPLSQDSEGRVFNSLFVVVDRYIKMAKYIPVLKMITVECLADVFIEYIVLKFRILEGIISD